MFFLYAFSFFFFFFWNLFLFKYHSDHSWSKNIQIINQKEIDVKDWSPNIVANDATLAYNLADVRPHPRLSGHQTIQHSFLSCELFEATNLSTIDYFFSSSEQLLGSQQGLEESAQPWHSAKIWPVKVLSKSRQHLSVLGASLRGYGQIGPWLPDGNSLYAFSYPLPLFL